MGAILAIFHFGGLVDEHAKREIVRCTEAYPKPGYTADDQGYAFQSTRRWQTSPQTIEPIYKQIDCQNPHGSKKYELCQQWRSANAAEGQACIAGSQYWLSSLTTYLSVLALAGLIATTIYTGIMAMAAGDSAKATERALTISRRPWLGVDPRLGTGLQTNAGDELRFVLDLTLWNNGRSPADNIQIFSEFCPVHAEARTILKQLRARAKDGTVAATPLRYKPIFPQEMETYPLPVNLRTAEIVRALPRLGGFINPCVVGCVVYQSPFAKPDERYDTGFIVQLSRVTGPDVAAPFRVDNNGVIEAGPTPIDDLRMEVDYFEGTLS